MWGRFFLMYNSPQDSRPPITAIPVLSRLVTSPTSSIHSRSLLFPSLPRCQQNRQSPPLPLPIVPSYSNPASPDPGPGASTPPHPVLQRSRLSTHLQRDYNSFVKLPPNYSSSAHDHTLPPPARAPPNRSWPISEHLHYQHLLGRVCCFKRQER